MTSVVKTVFSKNLKTSFLKAFIGKLNSVEILLINLTQL